MTREEIMQLNTDYLNGCESEHKMNELFSYVLELQENRQSDRDIKEIVEVMQSDVDAEIKCKMISNILTAKPHYFEEQAKVEYDPCETCGYVEGSSFCIQYCPYDAERKEPYDLISRADRLIDLANAIESDDSGYWTNKRISLALRNISSIVEKSSYVTQPIECNEAISRQAVLDINFKRIILTTAKPAETIEQKVKALPSVTRQTGEWIHLRGDMYECSKCRKIYTSFEIGECDAYYCPKCGAKMVEPQESEDKE